MKNRDSALRRYLRTIRSYLPCSRKVKKQILKEIQGNVNAYLEENPKADYAQIEVRFGSPKSIAAAYVDDMDTQELLHALHIRNKIRIAIVSSLFGIVLLWAVGVSYIMIHEVTHFPGTVYIEVEKTENNSDETVTVLPGSE